MGIASMVEDATNKALFAVEDRRIELAEKVINEDENIDKREVQVEENCLKVLALHQPVAADLCFIVTVLKVNNDLERMGDLAVNIAERALYLAAHPQLEVTPDFTQMAKDVRNMVRASLDSLTNKDTELAREVLAMDDKVDEANRNMFEIMEEQMRKDPDTVKRAGCFLSISRHLERIADPATNIAEDVVFMVEGELIRHRS